MCTESPKTFLYGGSFVPVGYQSLSGTFSGAYSLPKKPMSSSGPNESNTGTLNNEKIYMMFGNIPNPGSQGSNLLPGGGNLKIVKYSLGGEIKDSTYLRVSINLKDSTCPKVNLRDNI